MTMRTIRKIVVHHSAGGAAETLKMVDDQHKAKNWGSVKFPAYAVKSKTGYYVQYHYFIDRAGKVTQTRDDSEIGWHAGNWDVNTSAIGVCVQGNFSVELPNEKQVAALKELLATLIKKYNLTAKEIAPHRTFTSTECYGTKLSNTWAADLLKVTEECTCTCQCPRCKK